MPSPAHRLRFFAPDVPEDALLTLLRTVRGGYETDDPAQRARYSLPAQAALWLMRRVEPLGSMTRLLRYHY